MQEGNMGEWLNLQYGRIQEDRATSGILAIGCKKSRFHRENRPSCEEIDTPWRSRYRPSFGAPCRFRVQTAACHARRLGAVACTLHHVPAATLQPEDARWGAEEEHIGDSGTVWILRPLALYAYLHPLFRSVTYTISASKGEKCGRIVLFWVF